MDNMEITQHNLAVFDYLQKLPNTWEQDSFFLDSINHLLKQYFSAVQQLKGYVKQKVYEYQKETECLCIKMFSALSYYLKGKTGKAYLDMQEAYSASKDILIKKSKKKDSTGFEFGFKARVIENAKERPTKEEMFHIPFQLRHLVPPNRYSIHGIPSVYLGTSIYDCYIELGKPRLEDFFVSLYCFRSTLNLEDSNNPVQLIDLSFNNSHQGALITYHVLKKEQEYIEALDKMVMDILLWPLIKVCSMECKFPEAPFKQEYIIPQLIYQFCSQNDEFVGIKYLSTKKASVHNKIYDTFMMNYALPAYRVAKSGYCNKLAAELSFTEPINIFWDDISFSVKPEHEIIHRTANGFPIISSLDDDLKADDSIVGMDKMTVYFDDLIKKFTSRTDIKTLAPLSGWAD